MDENKDEIKLHTSKRLRELRKKKNVTLDNVATKTGINISTISNYENGYSFPKFDKLKKLSLFYGVTPSYIMGLNDEETYGFRDITDTKISSFNVFVESKEYNSLYFECKKQIINYLNENQSYLSDEKIEEISKHVARSNIEIFWNTYIKNIK